MKPSVRDAVWPAERVKQVYESTRANSPKRIPYTFRHPENNLPVFGHADRDSVEIFEEGGRTYITAKPAEMAAEWLAVLKKNGIDKVSVGLGKLGEVVHIGFTDSPAVSGLGAAFEASGGVVVPPVYLEEVEFEADDLGLTATFDVPWKWALQGWMSDVASLFQRLRDREIEEKGLDAADQYIPTYIIDYLKMPLPPDPPESVQGDGQDIAVPQQTYEETPMTGAEKAELERLQAENTRLLGLHAELATNKRQERITAFCADHANIVTPAVRPQIEALLAALDGVESPVTFEANGASVEKSAFDLFCDLVAGAKPAVVFSEVATHAGAPAGQQFEADPVKQELRAQCEAVKTP